MLRRSKKLVSREVSLLSLATYCALFASFCYARKSKDSTQLEESRIYVTKTKPSAKALGTRKI